MSAAKIYVGNLSWATNDDTLRQAFLRFGEILDSIVMKDRETGRSRGFGFITFTSQAGADAAIAEMNDVEVDGRRLKVNQANIRTYGAGGGGGGGGYTGPSGYGYQGAVGGNAGQGYNAYGNQQQQGGWGAQQGGWESQQQGNWGSPYGGQQGGYQQPYNGGGY